MQKYHGFDFVITADAAGAIEQIQLWCLVHIEADDISRCKATQRRRCEEIHTIGGENATRNH